MDNDELCFWIVKNYLQPKCRVTYEWEVRSSCDAVNDNVSAWSTTQEVTTVGCDTPTNLSSTNVLTDRATLLGMPWVLQTLTI